jgi:hypothetical protein
VSLSMVKEARPGFMQGRRMGRGGSLRVGRARERNGGQAGKKTLEPRASEC